MDQRFRIHQALADLVANLEAAIERARTVDDALQWQPIALALEVVGQRFGNKVLQRAEQLAMGPQVPA